MSRFGSTEVRIERQARRNMQLSVKKNWILIKAPFGVSDADIGGFVARHRHWIEAQLERQTPNRSSDHALLLGEPWVIVARQNEREPAFELRAQDRSILCPPPSSDSDWSKLYRKAAGELLPPLFKTVSSKLGLATPPLAIKTLSRAWGVCHSSGRVELHWGLVKLPLEQAVYVICHELAHLTHLDHSQAFWALCDQYCPGARRLDRALKSAPPPDS